MSSPPAATRPGNRLTRILWVLLGIVLSLLLFPAIVGSFIDEVFEGSATVRIERSAEEVWAAVADYRTHPVHGAQTLSADTIDDIDGLPAWEERMARRTALITTVTSEPPTLLVRRSENPDDEILLSWTLRIEPDGETCTVTLTQRIEVLSGGWTGANVRFWMLVLDEGARGARGYLEQLANS